MKNPLIIVAGLTALAGAAWFGATAYANNLARQQIDQELLDARDLADIQYDDVQVDLLTRSVSLKHVSIAPANGGEPVLIEELILDEFDQSSDIPSFLSAKILGAQVNAASLGELGDRIRELGYPETLSLNSDISYRYDDLGRELDINNLSLSADDAGTLNARLKLGNIQLGTDEMAFFRLIFGYPNLLVHGAELTFTDRSLVERIMQQRGKAEGLTGDQATNKTLAALDVEIANTKDPLGKEILSQFRRFIASPDTFSVTVQPEQPLKIRDIPRSADPVDIARMLNLQVKG